MKSRKVLFALVCVLLLAVMLPAVSLAATVYDNVDSYEDFRAALYKHGEADPGPVVINITDDFEVNMPQIAEWPKLPAGSTINGNNHTLKLTFLWNNQDGHTLITSTGNSIIKDITFDVTALTNGTDKPAFAVASLANGDTMENVKILGGSKLPYGVIVSGNVTVKNCTFKDLGDGIYTSTESTTMNITGSTFENCTGYAVILRGNGSVFSNNTVESSDVNAYGNNITLTENTFGGETRVKIYKDENIKEFSGNQINDDSFIKVEDAAKNTDVSKNTFENIDTALKNSGLSASSLAQAYAAHEAANKPAPVVPSTPSVPKTGDNSNIALWIALMAISALSFVALGRKSRFN